MKLRQLLLLIILLSSSLGICAYDSVCIYPKTGSPISILLSEKPELRYADTYMVISSNDGELKFLLSEVEKITFDNGTATSVKNIESQAETHSVSIYSLSGILLRTIDKNDVLDLNNLPNGTFILKDSNTVLKVHKAK